MRILLLGAGGFIGRHILSDLSGQGHKVVAVVRRAKGLAEAFPAVEIVEMDLHRAVRPSDWTGLLADIDVIVNAAGILRGREMQAIHVEMPRALYAAARKSPVKRVILISAISAHESVLTDYAASKIEGESALQASGLGWTILRPSLIYGDGSYGGTSLIRGMAGLPWFIPVPGRGDYLFTPLHARDLARAVREIYENARYEGAILEPAGPETMDLKELLARYRAWLGFGSARFLSVPMPAMRAIGRVGDLLGDGPISTNSLAQMEAGNAGDGAAFAVAIGFTPRSLGTALRERPAQVQDRWHARLFFLAPAVKATLFVLWFWSAILGLVAGADKTAELMAALGWSSTLEIPLRIATSLLDLFVAALVLMDKTARWSTPAQVAVIVGYSMVVGVALPQLWLDPLGPLLKNLPILALVFVHGAIGDKR